MFILLTMMVFTTTVLLMAQAKRNAVRAERAGINQSRQ